MEQDLGNPKRWSGLACGNQNTTMVGTELLKGGHVTRDVKKKSATGPSKDDERLDVERL